MSQHDFIIDSQGATAARTDINNGLQALASQSAGDAEPGTTYANQIWYETDTNKLKMRNEANSGWLNYGYIDQSSGFRPFEGDLVNTGGTKTAYMGVHGQATWEAGTNTEARLVSPAHVKAAIDALSSERYTSAEQTITRGGALTLPHGLSANPFVVQARYVCKIADAGYSIGDELITNMFDDNNVQIHGTSLVVDSTNINVRFGQGFLVFPHKTTGARTGISESRWRLVVRAMV